MKKRKVKKLIAPIVMLVILAALIAATVILKNKNSEEPPVEDTSVTVLDKTGKTVTKLEFKYGGQTLAFTYENDVWIYDEDEHFPVDGDDLSDAASAFMKVSATATVDSANRGEDREYGLDAPRVTAKASFSDGTAYTLTFGSTNPFNDCQYFTVTGDSNVYMAETTLSTTFAHDLNSYFKSERFPLTADGVTASNVNSITVTTAAGQEKVISDDDGKDELLSLVKVLNLSTWEDYYADEDELRDSYGISNDGDRVTVKYTVSTTAKDSDGNTVNAELPSEYTIRLGRKFDVADSDDSESGYFYSPVGSSVVYASGSETVDKIYTYLAYKPADTTAAE